MRARSDRQVQETRSALMIAFSQLLLVGTYEHTTVRAVAKRANVGRATFYKHFVSKEEILGACMERFFAVVADAVGAATPPAKLSLVQCSITFGRTAD